MNSLAGLGCVKTGCGRCVKTGIGRCVKTGFRVVTTAGLIVIHGNGLNSFVVRGWIGTTGLQYEKEM